MNICMSDKGQLTCCRTGRVLKHLPAHGLVKEVSRDQYCASPFSMATKDPATSGGLIYSLEAMIPTFHSLPGFLAKTKYQIPSDAENEPVQHGLKTTKPFFALLQEDARLGAVFNNFMSGYTQVRPRWVDYYPIEALFDGLTDEGAVLVDIGGGLGSGITSFNGKHPGLAHRLVLEETAEVILQVEDLNPDLASSAELLAHDFFAPQPASVAGARAYFLRLVLHDWSDEKCRVILKHILEVMKPGYSKLLINENVLSDVGAPWQQTSLDWTMMSMLVSREKLESQWRTLLKDCGFKITGIWQKHAASESVIEAIMTDG